MFDFIHMLPNIGQFVAFAVAFWAMVTINGAYIALIIGTLDCHFGNKRLPEWKVKDVSDYQEQAVLWGWASTSEWTDFGLDEVWEEPAVREEWISEEAYYSLLAEDCYDGCTCGADEDCPVHNATPVKISMHCKHQIEYSRRTRGEAMMVSYRAEALLARLAA